MHSAKGLVILTQEESSFDFVYAKAVVALILVCSHTGYVGCVPLQSKNQLDLMTREVVQFIRVIGNSEVTIRCDNEPAMLQPQRMVTKTTQAMGLKTIMKSSVAYDHGNFLAENTIARVRAWEPLCCVVFKAGCFFVDWKPIVELVSSPRIMAHQQIRSGHWNDPI